MTTLTPYAHKFTTSLFLQSSIYHFVGRIEKNIDTVLTRIRQHQKRRKFLELLQYSDRMLADMGLTRAAIERAATLPLQKNAAVNARELARLDGVENQTFWQSGRITSVSGPDRYSAVPGLFPLFR